MRLLSAYQIKARLKGKKIRALQPMPKEGSAVRAVYDKFTSQPGKVIEFQIGDSGCNDAVLTALRIYYGLDIRMLKQGSSRANRRSLWVLAGEWFGKIYIDYTADTDEHMDKLVEARYALQHVKNIENILPAGVHYLSKESVEILERVAAKGREILEHHLKENGDK